MAYIIADPCIDEKDASCTLACPVDCIYEGGRMFYIQPDECINCGLCLSICPVDAIHYDEEMPKSLAPFEAANREFFGPSVTGWGEPGGWDAKHTTDMDHPLIAKWPARTPETQT